MSHHRHHLSSADVAAGRNRATMIDGRGDALCGSEASVAAAPSEYNSEFGGSQFGEAPTSEAAASDIGTSEAGPTPSEIEEAEFGYVAACSEAGEEAEEATASEIEEAEVQARVEAAVHRAFGRGDGGGEGGGIGGSPAPEGPGPASRGGKVEAEDGDAALGARGGAPGPAGAAGPGRADAAPEGAAAGRAADWPGTPARPPSAAATPGVGPADRARPVGPSPAGGDPGPAPPARLAAEAAAATPSPPPRPALKFSYRPEPHELPYYDALFAHGKRSSSRPDDSDILPPKEAAELLLTSGLPPDRLRAIWNMSVMPARPYPPGVKAPPAMTREQFATAVRLVQLFQNRATAREWPAGRQLHMNVDCNAEEKEEVECNLPGEFDNGVGWKYNVEGGN
ncbi:hypothetical protein ACHAWF_015939 [Thalassiosira exigua]